MVVYAPTLVEATTYFKVRRTRARVILATETSQFQRETAPKPQVYPIYWFVLTVPSWAQRFLRMGLSNRVCIWCPA